MTTTLTALPQPRLPSEEPLGFEAWKQQGQDLFRVYEKTDAALEASQWDIGHWIVEGEKQFGKQKAYAETERITGWDRPYLYTVVWVVKRFPDFSLRKETTLKWSHFKELARIEDEKIREQVLEQLSDGFDHSVRDVRLLVDQQLKRPAGKSSRPGNLIATAF